MSKPRFTYLACQTVIANKCVFDFQEDKTCYCTAMNKCGLRENRNEPIRYKKRRRVRNYNN